jgi:hypothetical protein
MCPWHPEIVILSGENAPCIFCVLARSLRFRPRSAFSKPIAELCSAGQVRHLSLRVLFRARPFGHHDGRDSAARTKVALHFRPHWSSRTRFTMFS